MPTAGEAWGEEREGEAPRPVVMMSKPPGRPQSAPCKIARKDKGDCERVTLLSENYRRSMDCIDAVDPARRPRARGGGAAPADHGSAADARAAAADRTPCEPPAGKSSTRTVSENPAENDMAPVVPRLVIRDAGTRGPQVRKATVSSSLDEQSLARAPAAPAAGRGTPRQPVARTLAVDAGAGGEGGAVEQSSANQPNANPPGEWSEGQCAADKVAHAPPGTWAQDEAPFRRKSVPVRRPPSLDMPRALLPEALLPAGGGTWSGAHAAQGVDAQGHAQQRPDSRAESAAGRGPKGRGAPAVHMSMPVQRNMTTPGGVVFRDRRPSEKHAWQFRSASPGPAGAAYARPVTQSGNATRGQVLESGVTYLGSAHTAYADPRYPAQQNSLKLWPSSLRKSVWNSISKGKGAQPPETAQKVAMLCENPKLAEQLFEHYGIPMRVARKKIMLLVPFFDCLAHLEALQGSSPVLQVALEMTGMSNHEQGAAPALLTREHAVSIFESEASLFSAEPDGVSSGEADSEEAYCKGDAGSTASFRGLTAANFLSCLSRVSEALEEKRNELQNALRQMKVETKNKRLPMRDILELRGQARKDHRPVSPNSPLRQNPEPPYSPLAAISAMSKEVADPTAKQTALFKALKSQTVVSEYKRLARQVVRETMVQLDAAVKGKTRTRSELEWLLVLRDQALTSLGLIVSADQVKAARDDLSGPGSVNAAKGYDMIDNNQAVAAWGPPAWAWVVPSDVRKPISPVIDGWYLVSGDPGPKLRLMGPTKNRSTAIKGIQEFKPMDMKLFNICLMRDSTLAESFVFDASGHRVEGETSGATKADGWYVMIDESEKLLWTLGLEVQHLERELVVCKKDATHVRKNLRDLQVAAEDLVSMSISMCILHAESPQQQSCIPTFKALAASTRFCLILILGTLLAVCVSQCSMAWDVHAFFHSRVDFHVCVRHVRHGAVAVAGSGAERVSGQGSKEQEDAGQKT
eukprot:Tamp_03198.p1 GENE.Tamp_03198~~Tamp_03198.p1  ORF type:complete len:1034 (+),score=160.96 Tamp_03198:174-3104(+)